MLYGCATSAAQEIEVQILLTSTKIFGTIEQNLPQPFTKALFGLSGRIGGLRVQRPIVRELKHNIRLGFVGFFKIYNGRNISEVSTGK